MWFGLGVLCGVLLVVVLIVVVCSLAVGKAADERIQAGWNQLADQVEGTDFPIGGQ